MGDALKVLLLAALVLQVSAIYSSFDSHLQGHIDKALTEASSKFGGDHHVAFHSIIKQQMTGGSFYVNVLLKVTTCTKDSKKPYEHRDECITRKNHTPMIDCLVCKKNNEELIDCARKIDVISGRQEEIRKICKVHHIGGASILTQQSLNENNEKFGCLGCM